MAVIKLGPDWGGMARKFAADQLPDGMAALARDVDVRSHAVALLPSLTSSLTKMYDASGALTQDIPDALLTGPAQPSTPSRVTATYKANPAAWLTVKAKGFVSYYDVDDDAYETDATSEITLSLGTPAMTHTGFTVSATIATQSAVTTLRNGFAFTVSGPHIQVVVDGDAAITNGGPDADQTVPVTLSAAEDKWPSFQIPLYWAPNVGDDPQLYAFLSLASVSGLNWDKTFTHAGGTTNYDLPGGDVTLTFDLNYVEPRQQAYRFIVSKVDDAKEGPLSDETDAFTVNPGMVMQLDMGAAPDSGDYWRIYRTHPGGMGWFWMGDEATRYWTDIGQPPLEEGLPPTGPLASSLSITAGVKMHPANFAVGFKASGDTHILYRSDRDRPHIMPAENTVTFTQPGTGGAADPIFQTAILGGTIMVWTQAGVHAIGGSDPANAIYLTLTRTEVALSKLGVTQIGPVAYWVCNEGLAASSGGSVEVVTRDLYTRENWTGYWGTMSGVKAYAHGNAVVLSNGTKSMRVDLSESAVRRIVESSVALESAAPSSGTYTTRTYRFPRPVFIDYVRAVFTGTVTVSINGGTAVGLTSGDFVASGVTSAAATWSFSFALSGSTPTLSEAEAYERQVVEMDGPTLRLTPEMTPVMKDVWVKFPHLDRICAASVADPGADTAKIVIHDKTGGGTALVAATSLSNGQVASLDHASANSLQSMVRVRLVGNDGSASLANQPESLTLYTRRTRAVGRTVRIVNDGSVPEWLYTRYELEGECKLVGVSVFSSNSSETFRYWADGETSADSETVTTGKAFKLNASEVMSSIDIDFNGNDYRVSEIILHVKQVVDVGGGPLVMTDPAQWVGNIYRFPDRGTWAAMSVGCNGSTTVNLYGDGSAKTWWRSGTATINTGNVQFLNRELTEHSLWEIEVDADEAPDHIILYPRTRMDAPVPFRLRADDTGVMRWAYGRFELPEHFEPSSAQVIADSAFYSGGAANLYADGSATATVSPTVTTADEFPLHTLVGDTYTPMSRASALDLDCGGTNDYLVNEIIVYPKTIEMLGADGASWSQPPFRMRHVKLSQPGTITAVRVRASAAPTVQILSAAGVVLWNNGGSALTSDVVTGVLDGSGDPLADAYEFIVDVACAGEIYSVEVFPRQIRSIPNKGIILPDTSQTPNWNGWRFQFPEAGSFSVARVALSDYTGSPTLTLAPAGGSAVEFNLTDSADFKLLDGSALLPYARLWDGSIAHSGDVYAVHLIGMQKHKLSGPVLTIRRGEGPFSWLAHDFYLDGRVLFNCARIKASSYPGVGPISFKVFDENLTTELFSMNVTSGAAFRLPGASIKPLRQGRVDVIPPEGVVIEEFSMATAMSRLGS